MPSHLTRGVFRRLLSSQPVVVHRQRRRPSVFQHQAARVAAIQDAQQRRSFLSMFSREKPKRDPTQPLLDPGMREMLSLERKIHLMVRLQPPDVLIGAFNAFIKAKLDNKQDIEDFHAVRLLQTFDAVESHRQTVGELSDKADGSWFKKPQLQAALRALWRTAPTKLEQIHFNLAQRLFTAIDGRSLSELAALSTKADVSARLEDYGALVKIMAHVGLTDKAEALVEADTKGLTGDEHTPQIQDYVERLSKPLLSGYMREGNQDAVDRLQSTLSSQGKLQLAERIELVTFYAAHDDVDKLKRLISGELISEALSFHLQRRLTKKMLQEWLACCIRNNQMPWANEILSNTSLGQQEQKARNAAVIAAAREGRTPDEVFDMIKTIHSDAKGHKIKQAKSLFNALISLSLDQNNAYAAERYFSFLQASGCVWDTETYILQVQHRINANDLAGAMDAYNQLREQKISDNEDWGVMNRLVQFLASSPRSKKEDITSLAADLADRVGNFPPATVRSLALYHIQRDEYFEAADLLQTYSHQYSIRARTEILKALSDYALLESTDTARTWDTYMILHQVFDLEATSALREAFLVRMFARGRPDLGTHIFTRMIQHARADCRPTHSTYLACFTGIAATPDTDALQVVHNMLKLDTNVEPDTRMLTALMLAYIAVEAPWRALEFWNDIALSDEGPSMASLHAIMRACEKVPLGERTSATVWSRLVAADIAIDPPLFASYMGALAGNGQLDAIKATLPDCRKLTGHDPDFLIFATLLTTCRDPVTQEELEALLRDGYPGAMEEVEEKSWIDEVGMKRVTLDRSIVV